MIIKITCNKCKTILFSSKTIDSTIEKIDNNHINEIITYRFYCEICKQEYFKKISKKINYYMR